MSGNLKAALIGGAAITLALGGVTKAASVADLATAIKAVQTDCEVAHFPTQVQLIDCLNTEERIIWTKYAPEGLPFFDQWAARRARLTAAMEANTMTPQAGSIEMEADRAAFNLEIHDLIAEESRERQAQAKTAQAEQQDEAARAVLLGIAAYARARANSDAAAAAVLQQNQTHMSHTTCQPVFGTVQCTTTAY